jgi:hypothetical protein
MAHVQRRQAAAGGLTAEAQAQKFKGEAIMSQPDIRKELANAAVEPLLPIEKKLIGWSLGIGIVLLIILTVLARVWPASL